MTDQAEDDRGPRIHAPEKWERHREEKVRYRGTSDEPAITRLAGEHAARYFKQSFELKIEGAVIPDAAVEPLLAELQELFARHGASAALSAKATIKPTKEFHAARQTLFTVEQNHELNKVPRFFQGYS